MNRKGNCWDNAATETLFASLKVERLHADPLMFEKPRSILDRKGELRASEYR
jgi:putative transposase